MRTLEKAIRDISAKEKARLKKPLGITGRPYPMRDTSLITTKDGDKILLQFLGVLEEDPVEGKPLIVYSDRAYAEVLGMAMREMPTPGMLRLFFDAIGKRNPDSKDTVQYLLGAAGAGKTYMSELIARMRSTRGAIKVDCGRRNLGELLFETVLDFGQNKSFYDEFSKRIDAYNAAKSQAARDKVFHPLSLNTLEAHLGEAFSREGNKVCIDWNKTNQCLKRSDGQYLNTLETVKIVNEGLMAVARKEGFGHLVNNALGMATQEGPLIRAWKEGREIVLDEFNRGKEGTTSSLHTVLQFLTGEIDEVTVDNTLKEKGDAASQFFTFRREDQKAGFFVTLTGNMEEDGNDVEELAVSVNSRIKPEFIPLATEEDWQHRICQIMTGLPLSTIYNIGAEQARANPDAFRRKLLELRKAGLTKEQISNIPDIHLRHLRRWEDVLEASGRLAKFYYGWSQFVNPESPLYTKGDFSKLLEEVDDRYAKKVTIDFRKIIVHIQEAMALRPAVKTLDQSQGFDLGAEWSDMPVMPEDVNKEDPCLHFGTRLVNIIINHINKTTGLIGKNALFLHLNRLAADCGLAESPLHEGKKSEQRSVADLLNDNPFDSPHLDVKAEVARDLLCSYLRTLYPDINAGNDQLMSVAMVREALVEIGEGDVSVQNPDAAEQQEAVADSFIVFNEDHETLYADPLKEAGVLDGVALPEGRLQAGDLVSREGVLYALATPALRKRNLELLWSGALGKAGGAFVTPEDCGPQDKALAVADGTAESGLAVTTLLVSEGRADGKEKMSPLHLVWNSGKDRLLIVGDGKLAPDLKAAFNNARISYVNRCDQDAAKKLQAALGSVLAGRDRSKEDSILKAAFLMRSMLGSVEEENKVSLHELLARRDVKTYLPVYLARRSARPEQAA